MESENFRFSRAERRRLIGLAKTALVPFGLSRRQYASIVGAAVRRAKYGDSGCTPAGRKRQVAAARRYSNEKAKETCKHGHAWTRANTWHDREGQRHCRACWRVKSAQRRKAGKLLVKACRRGHLWTADNTGRDNKGRRQCRACLLLRAEAKQSKAAHTPSSLYSQQQKAVKGWATRRARYGQSGFTPAGRERVVANARENLNKEKAVLKTCRRGHFWSSFNTGFQDKGWRQCKACRLLASEKRKRLRAQLRRLKVLRQAAANVHPDHGGTSEKFCRFWKKYQAVKQELTA